MIVSHLLLILHKKIVLYLYVWCLKCGKRSQSSRGPNTFARHCICFYYSFRSFSYSVRSWGLRNVPATFQCLMNRVTLGAWRLCYLSRWCGCFIVTLGSAIWCRYRICLNIWLRPVSLWTLPNEFAQTTVTYLGRVVGQGRVLPLRAKVATIVLFPLPTTKKELQRFLGKVGTFGGFASTSPRL
jgi:hypothetical protein